LRDSNTRDDRVELDENDDRFANADVSVGDFTDPAVVDADVDDDEFGALGVGSSSITRTCRH